MYIEVKQSYMMKVVKMMKINLICREWKSTDYKDAACIGILSLHLGFSYNPSEVQNYKNTLMRTNKEFIR